MALLRNGLSYSQAPDNSSRVAQKAYDKAIAAGKTHQEAAEEHKKAYNNEMDWYES